MMKAATHGFLGLGLASLGVMGFFLSSGIMVDKKTFFYVVILTVIASGLPDMDIFLLGKRRHRGITHSLVACILLALFLLHLHDHASWIPLYSLMLFAGYTCHILTDIFSPKGVQLLWPSKKRFFFFPWNKYYYPLIELFLTLASLLISIICCLVYCLLL